MGISKKICFAALILAILPASSLIGGEEYLVEQKDKEFIYKGVKVTTLRIKAGEIVEFKNADPYFHNVFSLSDVKMFDLGSYPQGKSKSVKFDKPGKVEIECAIHPQMHMTIEVK
jgi:plastocyanin